MVEPLAKPLQDTTDETLSKEASIDNIQEVKEEPVESTDQTTTELQDITNQPYISELPDATTNLIVALPPDMQLNLNTDPHTSETVHESETKPCSVKLYRCDIVTPNPTIQSVCNPIKVNVVVKNPGYDLRTPATRKGNKATSTPRSRRSISQNVSYLDMFPDSSSEDTANESKVQPSDVTAKREPSHYRLAAHKYMLASRIGIISGPRVRTRANIVQKKDSTKDSDSDTTIIVDTDTRPKAQVKNKTTGRNKSSKKKSKQKTFVTRTYVLRKGGSAGKSKKKQRKPYLFKCLMCSLRWPTCRERNNHFKLKNRKLQCKMCNKFFWTPSAFSLHQYIHKDDQFECCICQSHFPFKSQLDHHMVSHNESREHKCQEPFCDKSFTQKVTWSSMNIHIVVLCTNAASAAIVIRMNETTSST